MCESRVHFYVNSKIVEHVRQCGEIATETAPLVKAIFIFLWQNNFEEYYSIRLQ